jgi:hypothetical protein
MPKLRRLTKKITPSFKYDPENPDAPQEKTNELKDGEKGKGVLVRKYIKNLDMEFYVARADEKGGDTAPVACRMSVDLVKDISIMLATGKTRFRDRSEFIRTATYILLNYYAQIVEGAFGERVGLRKMEDLIAYEQSEEIKVKKIIDSFETQFSNVAKDGDEVLHKYLNKLVDLIKNEKRPHIKNKLIKVFSKSMERDGIDPSEYFDNYETIKD